VTAGAAPIHHSSLKTCSSEIHSADNCELSGRRVATARPIPNLPAALLLSLFTGLLPLVPVSFLLSYSRGSDARAGGAAL